MSSAAAGRRDPTAGAPGTARGTRFGSSKLTEHQTAALALATTLADELLQADAAVLALPLYNWGVSQHVKTWIDLAIAGAPPGARLLEEAPVVLVTTRGGAYGPGMPKEGWDPT